MITQTIHEIHNPFDVYVRKMGHGMAMFLISGSVTSNPQFIVKFYHSGDVRTVDQNDIKIYGNPSAGESIVPYIPADWKPLFEEVNWVAEMNKKQ